MKQAAQEFNEIAEAQGWNEDTVNILLRVWVLADDERGPAFVQHIREVVALQDAQL